MYLKKNMDAFEPKADITDRVNAAILTTLLIRFRTFEYFGFMTSWWHDLNCVDCYSTSTYG